MQIEEPRPFLETIISQKYPFLNEEEISTFVNYHTWLQDEKDLSIIEQYIEEYFKSLAARYNNIIDSIEKAKKSENVPLSQPKQEDKVIAEENQSPSKKSGGGFLNGVQNLYKGLFEDKKSPPKQEQRPNVEEMRPSKNETRFEEFLDAMQILYKEIFEKRNNRSHFFGLMTFLEKQLLGLIKNIQDPNFRQIEIFDRQFKEDGFIRILNILGFEITLATETETLLFLNTDESSGEFFTIALDMINSLYLQNPQFMNSVQNDPIQNQRLEAQMNAPQQREMDRASFLASKHEQRLQNSSHPNSINRVQNNPSLAVYPTNTSMGQNQVYQNQQPQNSGDVMKQLYKTNTYLSDSTVKNQIEDYRNKMRNKFMDERKFNKNNTMTLSDLNNREKATDAIPRLPQESFNSKIITSQEIERRRIEEEKVKFGIRALELTNHFRINQGLSPLTWSQELCDVGMEHSKDMAEGKVPFGHHGFDKRCKKVKFFHKSMAENVAYNAGYSDPPKAAVEGWINSPGHRKNMLSNSNVCAISCYRAANGTWYFTQLFALRT